jgi:hypothetical protein
VEELYVIIEEICEQDGKSETSMIILVDGREWLEMKHITTSLDHVDWEAEIREIKCSLTSVKDMGVL